MVPNGSSDGQSVGHEAGTINVIRDESVGSREVAFSFCAGDFAGGCVNAQLLVLAGVRLVLRWSSGPVGEYVTSESLEVTFTFPCGSKESVPVSFIQNGDGAASTAHTLVSSDFGDVEQYWGCGNVIGSDVVWGRFGRESV